MDWDIPTRTAAGVPTMHGQERGLVDVEPEMVALTRAGASPLFASGTGRIVVSFHAPRELV